MSNLRDKILAAQDIKTEIVRIDEWDVEVEVRGMTGRQRAILLQGVVGGQGKNSKVDLQKLYPQLVVMSTFDPETGKPVFLPGDSDALLGKSGAALEKIAKVAMELSGLNEEDVGKNSESTPNDDSISS
jgi:hypothetical protein